MASEACAGANPMKQLDIPMSKELSWQEHAECQNENPELFTSDKTVVTHRVPPSIRAICNRCLVQHQCLEYAMGHPDMQGVWGGTSSRERAAMRRQQGIA